MAKEADKPKAERVRRPVEERAKEAQSKAAILSLQAKFADKPNETLILGAGLKLEKVRPTGKKDVDSSVEAARAALRNAILVLGK